MKGKIIFFIIYLLISLPMSIPVVAVNKNNLKEFSELAPVAILLTDSDKELSKRYTKEFENAMKNCEIYGIKAIKIDCKKEEQLCHRIQPFSLPEIRLNLSSGSSIYKEDIHSLNILNWVENSIQSTMYLVRSKKDLVNATKKFEQIIIGTFPVRNSMDFQLFPQINHQQKDRCLQVGIIDPTIKNWRVEIINTIINTTQEFDGSEGWGNFNTWLTKALTSLVGELNAETMELYKQTTKPVGIFFYDSRHHDKNQIYENATKVAVKLYPKMQFFIADTSKYWRLATLMGLTHAPLPSFCIDTLIIENEGAAEGTRAHFPRLPSVGQPTYGIDSNAIIKYCEDFLKGKIELILRSQKGPSKEEFEKQIIKTMVGTTFNSIVNKNNINKNKIMNYKIHLSDNQSNNKTKEEEEIIKFINKNYTASPNILILFTAQWCERSKNIRENLKIVAKELLTNNNNNIIIGEFDVSENDYPPYLFNLDNIPSLILFKSSGTKDKDLIINCNDFSSIVKIKKFLMDNIQHLNLDLDQDDLNENETLTSEQSESDLFEDIIDNHKRLEEDL